MGTRGRGRLGLEGGLGQSLRLEFGADLIAIVVESQIVDRLAKVLLRMERDEKRRSSRLEDEEEGKRRGGGGRGERREEGGREREGEGKREKEGAEWEEREERTLSDTTGKRERRTSFLFAANSIVAANSRTNAV